jgi:hypothetical protein
VFDEQCRDVEVAVRRRVVKGNQSTLVLSVDVGTLLQQVLGNLQIVVTSWNNVLNITLRGGKTSLLRTLKGLKN